MSARPLVSVIMANYRGARHIRAAIESVLAQTLRDLELIVVDDASPDESVAIIRSYAERDGRVRLAALPSNGGPSAARNRGLEMARGDWIAVVDNDDLIHPTRLATLVAAAEADGADIVADDLLIFTEGETGIGTMLGDSADAAFWVDPANYILSNRIYHSGIALGYCKPMFRAAALGDRRYDESLRIGEDSDLLVRVMLAGARFRIYPEPLYFYRKHALSISHRLGSRECRALLEAEDRAIARDPAGDGPVLAARRALRASLDRALAFAELVEGLKARSLPRTFRSVARRPSILFLLRMPAEALVRRMLSAAFGRKAPAADPRPHVLVLSRQRIAGATNGSSAYLLGIAGFLRRAGCRVGYLSPSPATFGRWPFLRVGPETRAGFDSFTVRGAVRVGDVLVVTDPRVWLRAALSVLEDRGLKAGLVRRRRIAPAPYAVSVPLTRADRLFVARQAGGRADAVLLDYAFLAEARPYVLRPDARALIVMHDLFSSRTERFARAAAADSVALLTEAEEFALLAAADGVVAIQKAEAEVVRTHLPDTPVIVAPMAVSVVPGAAPGRDGTLLFVGSNTAPNVVGLRWFLDEVWPLVRARHPAATLRIAGSVARALFDFPVGVTCLGVVPDLAPLYAEAGVVISPLTVGSGLKIKLVEALGFGKAVVATSISVEGVEDVVGDAVVVADAAPDFAEGIAGLLADPAARAIRGAAALSAARAAFGAEACYGPLLAALDLPTVVEPAAFRTPR